MNKIALLPVLLLLAGCAGFESRWDRFYLPALEVGFNLAKDEYKTCRSNGGRSSDCIKQVPDDLKHRVIAEVEVLF